MALTHTPQAELGFSCPDFTLPGTDGKSWSKNDFKGKKAFLVMFICNHCPYVKGIEDRLMALGKRYQNSDVSIVAISSNDANDYPEDSFDKMKLKNYPFPYLYDESQETAKSFGAVCTPDFFLFDSEGKLRYRGRLDDSWKDASKVTRQELVEAIEELRHGKTPSTQQISSMGCNIKWKK